MDFDVVIVGGGAAGIAAARRLARTNYSSVLLEADTRLGGRAWTHEVSGHPLDLGCTWFHSADRNSWVRIAEESDVPVDRSTAKWGIQYRDLGFPKSQQLVARQAFSDWAERLEASKSTSDRASDALLPSCEWNDYIRTIVGFISGGRLEDLSIADYLAYDEASTENNWRTPKGYGALIVGSMPSQVGVRLGAPVDSIALAGNGVQVATPAGTIRAQAAIIAISSCALAGEMLKLPAELRPWREAAAQLPLGRNEKLFLEIIGDSLFPDEAQVLGDPREIHTGAYYLRPLGAPVIECFFGGDGARLVESAGSAAAFDHALGQIGKLFGAGARSALRPLAASSWSRMKYIGGAYSYALPGQAAARLALARPFDNRVFFAGEATSTQDFSTAHGAHDTGVRAALEVLAALQFPGPG